MGLMNRRDLIKAVTTLPLVGLLRPKPEPLPGREPDPSPSTGDLVDGRDSAGSFTVTVSGRTFCIMPVEIK